MVGRPPTNTTIPSILRLVTGNFGRWITGMPSSQQVSTRTGKSTHTFPWFRWMASFLSASASLGIPRQDGSVWLATIPATAVAKLRAGTTADADVPFTVLKRASGSGLGMNEPSGIRLRPKCRATKPSISRMPDWWDEASSYQLGNAAWIAFQLRPAASVAARSGARCWLGLRRMITLRVGSDTKGLFESRIKRIPVQHRKSRSVPQVRVLTAPSVVAQRSGAELATERHSRA